MSSSKVCAASGTLLILGGWAGVMWVFLRALSLHLQICWQVVVGRTYMWVSQAAGWGIPILAVVLAIVFSGVSFRFGATCHINHQNSLADLWIPLLVFAGLTILIQFATFGYCIKVYLASLADNSASTEGSGLPSYTNSIKTMTPKQAYRRVRRVIQLQWRGIAIVLIIVADVIFFSIVFVFQDNTVQHIKEDPIIAFDFLACLVLSGGKKEPCLEKATPLVVNQPTVGALLILLAVSRHAHNRVNWQSTDNFRADQRPLAASALRQVDHDDGMGRLLRGPAEPQARVRLSRCPARRSQERYTFVRDAVPR
jgi:hypothetical protein